MARVTFFAPDLAETAQQRRIRSFAAAGHQVRSVSMHKGAAPVIDWPDTSLGRIAEQRLWQRLVVALRGMARLWAQRDDLRAADLIVARNLDMVVLALIARAMAGARGLPILYEVLDIHRLLTGRGAASRLARWVERRALARVALLVVSSPGFITGYFQPSQGFAGRWLLVENKLWFPGPPLPRPSSDPTNRLTNDPANRPVNRPTNDSTNDPTNHPTNDTGYNPTNDPANAPANHPADPDRPLTLGWVGAIRCQPSLQLLLATAAAMGPRLRIVIHGVIHHHALPDFAARIAAQPNVGYAGPYRYPDGLAQVYGACDLVWAQDLWQAGANSDWLLPNRIYEASWFGCPSVAVLGTQTAAKIMAEGLGFVIDAATPQALTACLGALTAARRDIAVSTILARPDNAFRLTDTTINAIVTAATALAATKVSEPAT